MVNRLTNKTAFITGSSSGIGRAIALAYANEGATVICTDLTPNAHPDARHESLTPTHEVILQRGAKAMFIKVDVLVEQEMEDAMQKAVDTYGRLDIIVNNAGIANEVRAVAIKAGGNRIHESETAEFDLTLAVNTRGTYFGCKYGIRHFLKQEPWPVNTRGDATRGWIVNIASVAGLRAFQGAHAYTASKHAVMGLTKEVAVSYAKDRIHCNAICPAFTRTGLIAPVMENAENPVAVATKAFLTDRHPWGSLGNAEDIARAAVFLASDDSQWITGTGLVVDGGYSVC